MCDVCNAIPDSATEYTVTMDTPDRGELTNRQAANDPFHAALLAGVMMVAVAVQSSEFGFLVMPDLMPGLVDLHDGAIKVTVEESFPDFIPD